MKVWTMFFTFETKVDCLRTPKIAFQMLLGC